MFWKGRGMFSKKIEYGYIIIQELKETNELNTKLGKDILKNIQVPYNMGLGILSELSKSELIISTKGKNGGYYLKNKDITFFELFNSLEIVSKVRRNKYNDVSYKEKILKINLHFLNDLKNIKILD